MPIASPNTKKGLVAKVQVGTIHGRLNYESDDVVFQHDPVAEKKRQIKLQVVRESRPNLLNKKNKKWDSSVNCSEQYVTRNVSQISKFDSKQYKYNFRAETLKDNRPVYVQKYGKLEFDRRAILQDKAGYTIDNRHSLPKRIQEMPIHPKLQDKPAWNGSYEINRRAFEMQGDVLHQKAKKNSANSNKFLLTNYKTPVQLEDERMARLREEKESGVSRAKPSSQTTNEMESRNRMGKQQQQRNKSPGDPIHRSRVKSSSRRYREYYNDGVWEYSNIEKCFVWSCSMNPNHDFRGSNYKTRNPDAWNFASP